MTESSKTAILEQRIVTYVFPPLFLSWRMYWANRMPIMDCDEIYNYWEPLHFLMHGSGQQTWEYAHEYALRTYAYIYPMKWISETILSPLLLPLSPMLQDVLGHSLTESGNEKLGQFLLLRAFLGVAMGMCELVWLYTLSKKLTTRHALWTGLLLLSGAGMNHAAAAYLPSSTWIMVWLLCSSCFLQQWYYTFCAIAVTGTLTIGWPFGVVILVPMGLAILWNTLQTSSLLNVAQLLLFTTVVTGVVQTVVMWIDEEEYGQWTSPTLNIFDYNAAGGGDELYGVEPASYYVKNLLLNWNIVAPLGIVVLPMLFFTQQRSLDIIALLLPLYLWFAITIPRPHKEERFLFPIYPLLCLAAVKTVDTTINAIGRAMASLSRRKEIKAKVRFIMHALVWSFGATLSLSRTVALSKYYTAPLAIYSKLATLAPSGSEQLVCTCGEWYRFPGSFYLPKNTQLGFLPSSFKGQLPQQFSKFGSGPDSRQVLQPFNDRNLHVPERYVDIADCRWIIDLEDSECFPDDDRSKILARQAFLDADRTSTIHRILYIPYLHERAIQSGSVHYKKYVLAELMDDKLAES